MTTDTNDELVDRVIERFPETDRTALNRLLDCWPKAEWAVELVTACCMVEPTLNRPWMGKRRVENLLQFAADLKVPVSEIKLIENDRWSRPPRSIRTYQHRLIGGVTFQYHVWAYVEEVNHEN